MANEQPINPLHGITAGDCSKIGNKKEGERIGLA